MQEIQIHFKDQFQSSMKILKYRTGKNLAPSGRTTASSALFFTVFPILLLTAILINSQIVHAAAIGVSKGELRFLNVLRNGYAEDRVYVSTDSADNLSIYVEFRGRTADWLSVKESEELWINRDRGQWLTIVAQPPGDLANGIYEGIVRVRTSPLPRATDGRLGTNIVASFAIQSVLQISDDQITACTPGGFGLADTEEGRPIELRVIITNGGNIRIRPTVVLEFYDNQRKNLITRKEVMLPAEVLPTSTQRFFITIPDLTLPIGQYWVDTSIPLCGKPPQELELSIFERGGISDRGELLRLEHPYVANTSDIVTIRAIFKNIGSRIVTAKFKGTINRDNAIVKIIDTDSVDVEPGNTIPIETFFQPDNPGPHEIVGRVLYNNKYTREKQSVMHINPSDQFMEEYLERQRITYQSFIPLLVLIILILIFLILIRKKKKKIRQHEHRIVREKRVHHKKLHDW